MTARIRESFLAYGWLIPVFLTLSHAMGRSVFTAGAAVYTAWGLAAFLSRPRLPEPRWALALYGLVLVAFAAGIPWAQAPMKALRAWSEYLWWSSAFPLTLWVMGEREDAPERLLSASLLAAAAMLAVSFGRYALVAGEPDVWLAPLLEEDTLPMLALLALGALSRGGTHRGRRLLAAGGILSASLVFILLAQGRAALLGLGAGCTVLAAMSLRWTWKRMAAAAGAIVVSAALLWQAGVVTDGRTLRASESLTVTLDRLTSSRLSLWRQAVETPPDRPLVGIGMGNLKIGRDILSVVTPEGALATVRHLHNFLLDCWYETGWFGLSALLAFLGAAFLSPLAAFRRLPPERRPAVAALFAAGTAIVVAALFSFSYASKYFAMYLPVCLAAWIEATGATGRARAGAPPAP